ncbi:hypothetical protein QQS45_10250 [Alteriqipengyuania flavescens]|uniref:DUF4139 domain-containing protein n=1 Tax=Alteriqipengyuania flavescens TaxID=3053610 RepID=UPI0025B4F1F9|nr:hypothetical protein [Alteriqipengyuania flavescens]WJY18005.1 hypothetical protein QQW98_10245 [Alteriqipengyuania flavescens]WJY23946.1 hypothetical protein QQS45_10250 [Alteriqipengyuania flavescens]
MRPAALLIAVTLLAALPAAAQEAAEERVSVEASAPRDVAVTIYRDPYRGEGGQMNARFPRGFGMISETRTVTLPAGRSTIRFEGVAEGMVAVSAIVTGLPGGTIEKNRNADLLSPASLVDGTLGNQVTITRTNPATGESVSEPATVRTRADGGLVLETEEGFTAVRCSGVPERLTFNRVPDGLSAQPVYSVDTFSETGGTYTVQLSYLSSGFDWQAHYVGTLSATDETMRLVSWLTVLNTNGQSFPDAEMLVVAGGLSVTSDFRRMSEPPQSRPLRLECYPIGSTARGSPVPYYGPAAVPPPPPPPPPPVAAPAFEADSIIVTGSSMKRSFEDATVGLSVVAQEEELGDLKLFRVPVPVNVAASGIKQVAFLQQDAVAASLLYLADCGPNDDFDDDTDEGDYDPLGMLLKGKNDLENGLGQALPMGELSLFEPSDFGPQLVAQLDLRDFARGQDIELELGESAQVQGTCGYRGDDGPSDRPGRWTRMRGKIANANPHPVRVRIRLADTPDLQVRWPDGTDFVKDGYRVAEVTVPANATRRYDWRVRDRSGR